MDDNYQMTSLRSMVRKYILEGIAEGSFASGDKVSDQEIADSLGVSRTPIREALLQLNSEGLLDYHPRRGFFIRKMDEKEKWDLYELIGALDAFCARSSVGKLDDRDFMRMNEIIDKIEIAIKYENVAEYKTLEMQFHDIYRKKNDNKAILRILENAEAGIVPQTFVGEDTKALMELYRMLNEEHRKILELLKNEDAAGVEDFLINVHWAERYSQFTN